MRSVHTRLLPILITTAALEFSALHSYAQGALTPPGAPAPMMKTLSQMEPRTAITNSGAVTISQPGSYYLTTNITVSSGNGIAITASNVTLDLEGFTIFSTASPAGGYGISLAVNNLTDITILNGHIRGSVTNNGSGVYSGTGFQYGIYYPGVSPFNVRVSNVSVSGCSSGGIYLWDAITPSSTIVDNCTVRTVGGTGIAADKISDCTAVDCSGSGINGAVARDCRGESTGSGAGVNASVAENCHGTSASGDGVYAIMAHNCYGLSTSGYGLYCLENAEHCYGRTTSGSAGLFVQQSATYCTGYRPGGAAIQAFIETGCVAESGTNNATYKYNMP